MDPEEECQTLRSFPYPTSHPAVLTPTFRPMAMIWDAPLTAAVAKELESRLASARLRGHVFDWDRREVALFFRGHTLRWALHPRSGWVTLDPAEDPPGSLRPLSAELLGVGALPDERVLRMRFRKVRGRVRDVQLVVELMTNQWNALMVEGPEERIRHLLWTRPQEDRPLVVGHPYRPPPPSSRRGIQDPPGREEWKAFLRDMAAGASEHSVLDGLAFSSGLNLPALLAEEGPSNKETEEEASGDIVAGRMAGYTLWSGLRTLEDLRPCILESTRDKQPYVFDLYGFDCRTVPTILDAVRAMAEGGAEESGTSDDLLKRVDRALRQASGRVRGIQREMSEAGDPDEFRERANLLLARLGQVRRGASQVTLTGFQGDPVTITLDPTLTPHENAEALYREAARQERAAKRLPPLLAKAEARLQELTRLRDGIIEGDASPDEIRAVLPGDPDDRRGERGRWGDSMSGGGPPRSGGEGRLPFRRFQSSGGLEIRVGKGSRDNDALTFRHARPDDVWLHAREAGGAHVVLRWTAPEPPPTRDLAEAAILAALNSRARHAGVVPVDWTRRKYVRKPRKAPPGSVTMERSETLFVEPDPDLPGRLSGEG